MNKNKNYLFLCTYGQSRSRFFAEKCMLNGFKCMFAGTEKSDDNNIQVSDYHFEWADIIILLDNTQKYDKQLKLYLQEMCEKYGNKLIKYYIKDEPKTFNKIYPKLLLKIKNENKI